MMKYLFRIKNSFLVIVILLMAFNYNAKAQANMGVVQDTKMEIQFIDKQGNPFEAFTNSCFMFLNLNNGDFMFKTDANTFETEDSFLDSVINNNGSQAIVFKGNMIENISRFVNDSDDGKMYDMKGVLTINGIDILCVAQYDPISFGEKSDTKNYRLEFRLSVDANKINMKGLENKLTKVVLFEVSRGILNITN